MDYKKLLEELNELLDAEIQEWNTLAEIRKELNELKESRA